MEADSSFHRVGALISYTYIDPWGRGTPSALEESMHKAEILHKEKKEKWREEHSPIVS